MSDDLKKLWDGSGMKPIIILPPDTMCKPDMQALRDNGLCVVVAKDPARVKFLDPIPSAASRTKIECAAIQLSRKILTKGFWTQDSTRGNMAAHFVDLIVQGTPLDPNPSQQEREQEIFDRAKAAELEQIARSEAHKERAMKRAAKKALDQKT